MLIYAILYALQVVFSPLYAEALNPSEVWNVMNYCTAVGILISVGVVWGWVRGGGGKGIGRYAVVFAILALGVWFFSRWFKLLMMDEGESVSEADNVVWAIGLGVSADGTGGQRAPSLEVTSNGQGLLRR